MAEPGLQGQLIKNTAVQVAAQAASLIIGLLSSVVLSRYLGVERFGEFNYIFAFYFFFLAINDLGVNSVAVREISKDPTHASEIIGALLPVKALQASISVVGAWALIWLMGFPPGL